MKKKKLFALILLILILLFGNVCLATNSFIKDTYKIDNNFLTRILPGTDMNEFKKHFIDNTEIINEDNIIGTGKKIHINNQVLELVVVGDVNGDGKLTATDLTKIKNHVLGKNTLGGTFFKAVDLNYDNIITATELTKFKNYILGLNVKFFKEEKSKFEWDLESDASLSITPKNTLNYKVIALNENGENINNIKWEVSSGTLDKNNGTEVTWTIPKIEDKYIIKAKLETGATIEKEINYINLDELDGEQAKTIEYSENDDIDGDGLTNKQETEYKTDILKSDTDEDGLSDYEEVIIYKTDPLKKDTDGDGILDINEIRLGLNPLKKDSNNNRNTRC